MILDALLVALLFGVPTYMISRIDKVGLGPSGRSGGANGTTAESEADNFIKGGNR